MDEVVMHLYLKADPLNKYFATRKQNKDVSNSGINENDENV